MVRGAVKGEGGNEATTPLDIEFAAASDSQLLSAGARSAPNSPRRYHKPFLSC